MPRNPDANCRFSYQWLGHIVRDLQTPDRPTGARAARFWAVVGGKAGGVQIAELKQRHCGACKQAGQTTKKKSRSKDQKGEDCGGQRGGWSSPSLCGGGLPLNQGEVQYLTLRDLSSQDHDREEGKVGREEAAVPKGPLPI